MSEGGVGHRSGSKAQQPTRLPLRGVVCNPQVEGDLDQQRRVEAQLIAEPAHERLEVPGPLRQAVTWVP